MLWAPEEASLGGLDTSPAPAATWAHPAYYWLCSTSQQGPGPFRKKLGLSVKRGQKQARGFLMGTPRVEWGCPCAPHSLLYMPSASPPASPLDTPQVVSFGGPFHVAVVSLSQARLCPRAPREVHLLPYQDGQGAASSQWVLLAGPRAAGLGLREADGSGPPCLVTTGCFRRLPSQGHGPGAAFTASRAKSSLVVAGASVSSPGRAGGTYRCAPGKYHCPSAALTEHLLCAEAALPGAGCGHRKRPQEAGVGASPAPAEDRVGNIWESGEGLARAPPSLLPARGLGVPRTNTLSRLRCRWPETPEGVRQGKRGEPSWCRWPSGSARGVSLAGQPDASCLLELQPCLPLPLRAPGSRWSSLISVV